MRPRGVVHPSKQDGVVFENAAKSISARQDSPSIRIFGAALGREGMKAYAGTPNQRVGEGSTRTWTSAFSEHANKTCYHPLWN